MEEESFSVFRNLIPREWVIHEYRPDYGIDLTLELFEMVSENACETLGEHVFVQLKSVNTLVVTKHSIPERFNVEKMPLGSNASRIPVDSEVKSKQISVIAFDLETSELLTVQTMGAAAVVILVLVALDCRRVFFLCLNDYIDKVLLPADSLYAEQESKRLYIPVTNEITAEPHSLMPLRLYGKRAKIYTAASKFAYQLAEVEMATGDVGEDERAFRAMVSHFVCILKSLTVWEAENLWPLIALYKKQLETFERLLSGELESKFPIQMQASELWHGLGGIGRMFEEVGREWFLPTGLGQFAAKDESEQTAT